MTYSVSNYDGGITASPRQYIHAETVEQIQAILRDKEGYPSPVRAMGSYHSLTPCASSDGTMVNMSRMDRVLSIDHEKMTFTAQAGLELIVASKALWEQGVQMFTNVEIGNLTLGSAACCQTKDALDGIEFGQVGSYVTKMKWVSPSGELREADEERSPELLRKMRSSYGNCGIVYEVTFRIKPIEAARLTYLPLDVDSLTEEDVTELVDGSEGLICWTVGRKAVFQVKKKIAKPSPFAALAAEGRHILWNKTVAFFGRAIEQYLTPPMRDRAFEANFTLVRALYAALHATGGLTVWDPAKIVDYRRTDPSSKYVFTFWAFPRAAWLTTLREYLDFADEHFKTHGFRCNMPLGAYRIRRDRKALLSYTHDGDMFSIDPIHAPSDRPAWDRFLHEFNDWAIERDGIPLLNQSAFITREMVETAYGERWKEYSRFVRAEDPEERMLNPFFRDLLSV